MRDEAWKDYVSAPGFQRRRERGWAWRARPCRPLAYAALAALVLGLGAWAVNTVQPPEDPYASGSDEYYE